MFSPAQLLCVNFLSSIGFHPLIERGHFLNDGPPFDRKWFYFGQILLKCYLGIGMIIIIHYFWSNAIRIRAFSIVISICLKSMFRQFVEQSHFCRAGTEISSYTCYHTFDLESDMKWGMPSHGRCEKPQENTGNVERRWRIIFSANCMDLLMDVRSKCSTAELREDFLRKRKVTYCFFL